MSARFRHLVQAFLFHIFYHCGVLLSFPLYGQHRAVVTAVLDVKSVYGPACPKCLHNGIPSLYDGSIAIFFESVPRPVPPLFRSLFRSGFFPGVPVPALCVRHFCLCLIPGTIPRFSPCFHLRFITGAFSGSSSAFRLRAKPGLFPGLSCRSSGSPAPVPCFVFSI